jgi:DNA-directed RNA polymerase subunit E'/Rpb7
MSTKKKSTKSITKKSNTSDSLTLSSSSPKNTSSSISISDSKKSDKKMKSDLNIVNPYINTNLATQILLKPNQLDNNIYINMKQNLKKYLEGKCNKYGFIQMIHKILEHKDGIMVPEDLTGSVLFDVKYSALICVPIENTNIICKITKIENNLFTAQNGPILIILKQSDINSNIFTNERGDVVVKNGNRKLNVDDYVVVYIRNKRYYSGDTTIIAMARLENIPSEKEIEEYYYPPKVNEDEFENNIKEDVLEAIDSVNAAEIEKSNMIDL